MRKITFLFLISLLFIGTTFYAQPNKEQRIQDSIIGWWANPHFDNHLKIDNTPLQKKKIAHLDKFVEWMKKSYTPVGGLGTFTRNANKSSFNVFFLVWNVNYNTLDSKGHFTPVDEENTPFRISANLIPGSYPVSFLNSSSSKEFFFTWPPDGYKIATRDKKPSDPKIHPNVYKYITHINEDMTVFLAPNNKLPFILVTIGEYLKESEASLIRNFEKEKEVTNNQWPGDNERDAKSRNDVNAIKQKGFDRYKSAITKLRDKYSNNLNEPTIIRDMQPTLIGQFSGDSDPFAISKNEKANKQYFPVYKLDATTTEKCKSDQPQWLAINFPYETKEDGNQLYEMYQALTENFNYDYVYNYFFNPEKVKGIAYKPANEEQLKVRLDTYRKNDIPNKITNTKKPSNNSFFEDDFANNTEGNKPSGWYSSTFGKHSVVSSVKNETGKWIKLGYNNPISSTSMKKPLPENFTLEYDVATDEFSSRTGGAVNLHLSSFPLGKNNQEDIYANGTVLEIEIKSGNKSDYNNNNYSGVATIAVHSKPSVNKDNNTEGSFYTYPLKEFTNKESKIHVTFKVNAGEIKLFINENEVAISSDFKMTYGKPCISCNLPAGTKFKTVYWKNTTNDSENVNVYISNIKISNN
jgi:hypothetical protein